MLRVKQIGYSGRGAQPGSWDRGAHFAGIGGGSPALSPDAARWTGDGAGARPGDGAPTVDALVVCNGACFDTLSME